MRKIIHIIIFAIIAGLITNCTSGGRSLSKTPKCPKTFSPVNVDNNQKFSAKLPLKDLKDGDSLSIKSGDYAYNGSSFLYYDEANDVQIHFSHAAGAKSDAITVNCLGGRGVRENLETIDLDVPIISDLMIEDSGNTFIRKRIFKFKWQVGQNPEIKKIETVDTQYVPGIPVTEQPQFENNDQYFMSLKNYDKNFETIYLLDRQIADQGNGKKSRLIVNATVYMKVVSAEERNKIEESNKENNDSQDPNNDANL